MRNETRPERYCRGFDYQKLPIPKKTSREKEYPQRVHLLGIYL